MNFPPCHLSRSCRCHYTLKRSVVFFTARVCALQPHYHFTKTSARLVSAVTLRRDEASKCKYKQRRTSHRGFLCSLQNFSPFILRSGQVLFVWFETNKVSCKENNFAKKMFPVKGSPLQINWPRLRLFVCSLWHLWSSLVTTYLHKMPKYLNI